MHQTLMLLFFLPLIGPYNHENLMDEAEKIYLHKRYAEIQAWRLEHLAPRLGGREFSVMLPMSGSRLYLAPNRKHTIPGEIPFVGKDPLLDPQTRGEYVAEWRDRYYLYVNKFPYLDDHILLISQKEEGQGILDSDPRVFADTLDLQSAFPHMTLTFNHLAGNSLNHFHIHLSPQTVPIEKTIAEGSTLYKNTAFTVNDRVETQIYDNEACARGFYFSGEKGPMTSTLSSFLKEITHCADFYYNLIYLPMQGEKFRILVTIRWRPEQRELFTDSTLPYPVLPAALELSGGLMHVGAPVSLSMEDTTKPFLNISKLDTVLRKICDYTIVSPRDLNRFLKLRQCKTHF